MGSFEADVDKEEQVERSPGHEESPLQIDADGYGDPLKPWSGVAVPAW